MNIARTTLTAIVTLLLLSTAQAARADYYDHLDELALDVQLQARQLTQEFGEHYAHTRDIGHLMSDAASLNAQAARLHMMAHLRLAPYQLEAQVDAIDELVHHLERLLSHIESGARFGGFHGHVHGDTRHVQAQMDRLESDVHHLRSDIKALTPPPVYRRHDRFGRFYDGYHGHRH
ncbi:hypothetical protein [Lignipirellula cremea]|uniref:Uncharacterized protein n=1 Tax=Lignipirellula cremea TaxID=2528010 RepID=A0A518DQ23_9BACT|nr:hypothetical protein [Lignipirellula cremea]QDU93942.1 hypothetical protein Pla8534_17280 [Lignipirellula cremea]